MTAEVLHLPFRVTGTVLAPREKFVHLLVLDEKGKEEGTVRVREGESIKGYRVTQIENQYASFEKDGQTVRIAVGNDRLVSEEKKPRPRTSQAPPMEMKGRIVPPPENVEEVRKEAERFFEKLREHPEFKKRLLEEKKRQLGEQQEKVSPID